jgi:hypothetical protein
MLRADLDLDFETISPGSLVLGAGLGVVVLGLIRAWWRRPLSIGKAVVTHHKALIALDGHRVLLEPEG